MEPIFTGDTIKDILNNINRGIIFVFWDNKKVLCYHKKELENNYIIPTESVVYCDCREASLFLDFLVKILINKTCNCNIKNIVKTRAKFGRVTHVRLQ